MWSGSSKSDDKAEERACVGSEGEGQDGDMVGWGLGFEVSYHG